ncbi:MAG: hypothetical protein HY319_03930 [Armatimonadetes bacterium]|nr:hypothetical protein [Armatimonadota bacterium]
MNTRFHTSAPSLPLANGTGTAIYDTRQRRVTGFFNHPYKKRTSDEVSADLCQSASIELDRPVGAPGELGYVNGTGILRETSRHGELQVEKFQFMPMAHGGPERTLVLLAKITNTGQQPVSPEAVATLDFHVGAGKTPDPHDQGDGVDHKWYGVEGERILSAGADTLVESAPGQPHLLVYRNLGEPAEVRATGDEKSGRLAEFHSPLSRLAPGESRWVGVMIGHEEQAHFQGPDWQQAAAAEVRERLGEYAGDAAPERLLADEMAYWQSFHASEPRLENPDREAVYRQSTAFLKMGQVREPDHPESSGQILASLKDKWARAWVRDMSYATVGLVRSGHLEEARRAIEFMLRNERDRDHDYLAMINDSLPEGRKLDGYGVSVCRAFGSGREESDWNDHGPNIEFDDLGLFLWAFSEVAGRLPEADGQAFLRQHLPAVRDLVAEPLVRLTDDKGLIAPDSSIWEHHWTLPLQYDGRRQYAYTTIAAFQGLSRFAELLGEQGGRYAEAAGRLQEGVRRHLLHGGGAVASSYEDLVNDPPTAYDAAALEAVNWGLVDGAEARATVESLFSRLASRTPGSPGVVRNDDGNWYDSQEWLLLDLRGVEARRKIGEPEKAEQLLDWVTGWSRANFDGIGELLDEKGNFEGPFPMAGFGPGAYILAAGK